MRIGVVTTSYPRAPDDAAGNFVAAHVEWLLGRGHEVDVVCAGDAERAHGMWQPGTRVTTVPAAAALFYRGGAPDMLEHGPERAGAALAAARFSARMTAAVARRARHWDAAFAHWLAPSALALALSRDGARMPTLAIAHSGDVHLLRRLRMTALCARMLRHRDTGIAFVSHALREQFLREIGAARLRAWVDERSLVTPMGIDVARFRALRRPSEAPDRTRERALRVSFIGRLVPIKGVPVLLEAVARLHSLHAVSRQPVELTIAGHGPSRGPLERQASALPAARVRFTGELTTRERDRLLARTDLLVLPSLPRAGGRTEGTPVTALEAMAAGVPVIASRTGGLAELPESALALVPPGDAHALALAIQEHARGGARHEQRVAVAMAYAERLDWEHVGGRLFSLMGGTRSSAHARLL